jgi:hypothetical protein
MKVVDESEELLFYILFIRWILVVTCWKPLATMDDADETKTPDKLEKKEEACDDANATTKRVKYFIISSPGFDRADPSHRGGCELAIQSPQPLLGDMTLCRDGPVVRCGAVSKPDWTGKSEEHQSHPNQDRPTTSKGTRNGCKERTTWNDPPFENNKVSHKNILQFWQEPQQVSGLERRHCNAARRSAKWSRWLGGDN